MAPVERIGLMAGLLGPALVRYLAQRRSGQVYVDPAGFTAFIDGGANVGLYQRVIDTLATIHAEVEPESVLDIGCGDGRVTAAVVSPGTSVSLLEPSAEMLATAAGRLPGAEAYNTSLGELLAANPKARWDLAQSTFALHAIDPGARPEQLAELATRCRRLLVVEFDVPALADRSPDHLSYLADRYEAGLAEYPDDDLVALGFLMPVLVGQLDPDQPRHTWEQPIGAWVDDLHHAGFGRVETRPIADYWWAPAHMIDARIS